jgi:poly(A) polymerase Pap1
VEEESQAAKPSSVAMSRSFFILIQWNWVAELLQKIQTGTLKMQGILGGPCPAQ